MDETARIQDMLPCPPGCKRREEPAACLVSSIVFLIELLSEPNCHRNASHPLMGLIDLDRPYPPVYAIQETSHASSHVVEKKLPNPQCFTPFQPLMRDRHSPLHESTSVHVYYPALQVPFRTSPDIARRQIRGGPNNGSWQKTHRLRAFVLFFFSIKTHKPRASFVGAWITVDWRICPRRLLLRERASRSTGLKSMGISKLDHVVAAPTSRT